MWKAEKLGNLLNGMLTYVVVVVVQLRGVEFSTFTQEKGVTLLPGACKKAMSKVLTPTKERCHKCQRLQKSGIKWA